MKHKKSVEPMPEAGHRNGIPCYGQYACEYCGINFNIASHQDLLLGKVLTVIDASLTDSDQRKAVKDLIKGHFYQEMDNLELGILSTVFNCTTHRPSNGLGETRGPVNKINQS